jgi:hypothetical protein
VFWPCDDRIEFENRQTLAAAVAIIHLTAGDPRIAKQTAKTAYNPSAAITAGIRNPALVEIIADLN